MLLLDVVRSLARAKVDYAIVGGWAVALNGVVRGTVDLDLVISFDLKAFRGAEAAFNKIGLHSRLPVKGEEIFQFREEYIRNRNLIAWSFWDPKDPTRQVDIVLTHDRTKVKTKTITIQGVRVHVIEKRALIQMKRDAGRPQDLIDAKALEEVE